LALRKHRREQFRLLFGVVFKHGAFEQPECFAGDFPRASCGVD
jgi:hypothetical protein